METSAKRISALRLLTLVRENYKQSAYEFANAQAQQASDDARLQAEKSLDEKDWDVGPGFGESRIESARKALEYSSKKYTDAFNQLESASKLLEFVDEVFAEYLVFDKKT